MVGSQHNPGRANACKVEGESRGGEGLPCKKHWGAALERERGAEPGPPGACAVSGLAASRAYQNVRGKKHQIKKKGSAERPVKCVCG